MYTAIIRTGPLRRRKHPITSCTRALLSLGLFLLLIMPVSTPADTNVGGTISTDTTWTLAGSPYVLASNIKILGTDGADGITTLTIEPGVVVKLNASQYIEIGWPSGSPGALSAMGTAENPITFTSNAASQAPGDWRGLYFYNTVDDTTTVMEHCVFEYGGSNYGPIYMNQASPTFRHVSVQNSNNYGVYILTSQPTIENCTFSGNQNYDLFYTGTVAGSVTGSTINSGISLLATGTVSFSGNTINQNNDFPIKAYADNVGAISASTFNNVDAASYLEVNGGTLGRDATWTAAVPYAITANVTVKGTDGADSITTLTIEPGAVVKFNSSRYWMFIGASSGDPGALIAQGTSENPITFTSNQASPAPGDWRSILFYNTTDDATTVMEHCVVEYGGYSYGALYANQASPAFRHVSVQNSKNYGIYVSASQPTIENCTFSGNQNYDLYYTGTVGGSVTGSTINSGISLLATGTVNFSGNTINQNNDFPIKAYVGNVGAISASTFNNVDAASYLEVNGGTLGRDATWTAAVPYAITANVTVKGTDGADNITTLTMDPGTVVKFNSSRYLFIGASSGDPGALIAQGTSDDPILFTSNQASPAPGDWRSILFYNTCDDATTVMEHCVVEYGGYSYGALYLNNAAPRILNTTIQNANTAGIYATGTGTSTATVNCNTFTGNDKGIHWTASPPPEMHNNNFSGNTNHGIYYTGAATLNAEDNWWGDSAGPNQTGDNTYGSIDAEPWSSAENQCTAGGANNPPNTPAGPSPEDNAVRVSIDSGTDLTWSGGDPDPLDIVTYDLYMGSSADSLALTAQDISGSQYQAQDLLAGTTYFWQIIAKDNNASETTGPIWRFTTDGDPPDLVVASLSITPGGNLQSGQTTTLSATIQNISAGPAVDAFSIDFEIDGASIGSVQIDPIVYGGESITVNQTWTYNGGDPNIVVTADSQLQISETSEDNNKYIALLSEVADNTAPSVISVSPGADTHIQSVSRIDVTLMDSQSAINDAAVMASFKVIDPNQQNIIGTIIENNDVFSFTPQTLSLTDGVYQVNIAAVDTYGNSHNHQFFFTTDTIAPAKPTITGGIVASGTIQPRPEQNTAEQFIVEITGTRDAGTSVWINAGQVASVADDDWSSRTTIMPGDNAIEIWRVDRAGNRGLSEWVDISIPVGSGINYQYNSSGRLKRSFTE